MIAAHHNLALSALPDVEAARTELRRPCGLPASASRRWNPLGTTPAAASQPSFTASVIRWRGWDWRLCRRFPGSETAEYQYMYADLVRICQEAATNAIKHGSHHV